MMKCLTPSAVVLFVVASALPAAAAARTMAFDVSGYGPSDSRGFLLDKRGRSARKEPVEIVHHEHHEYEHEYIAPEESSYSDLRRWKEEDYEALMSAMSSGNNNNVGGGPRYSSSSSGGSASNKMRQLRGSSSSLLGF